MRFGWLTLSLSPSPEEDAARIEQQIDQVRSEEPGAPRDHRDRFFL